ncbi:transcriptional regulator, GntR family [Paenibacillus aquistagni]|uniref:Transcriptional regulator, GntR family n=2 Tax=Paenibacillus aquistagni TaxID=1852522 RepID=A0A1X7LWF8_9BACL|nr:transcriptional regulator, GntR family [Paenibacillus aquistagni]
MVLIMNKPLYAQIAEHLIQLINAGQYHPNDKIPTEMELAEQFGVSRITTKRALLELENRGYIYRKRGSGSFVKEPSITPAPQVNMNMDSSHTRRHLSIVLPYVDAGKDLHYFRGVADYIEKQGIMLSLHFTDWRADKERDVLLHLRNYGTGGIIWYPVNSNNNVDIAHILHAERHPLVLLDQYYDGLAVPSVVSDNRAGGYAAAEHLIKQGHRRIAFVSSILIEQRSSVRDRFLGYCQAHMDYGIPLHPEYIVAGFHQELWAQGKSKFYSGLIQPLINIGVTAIQAEHDYIGLDIIDVAMELGMKVPEQLSIIGYDNISIAGTHQVPLTTVNQNCYEIGRKAAELMYSMMSTEQGMSAGEHGVVSIPVQFIERQSTSPVTEHDM